MLIGDSESDSFKFESTLVWVICMYDMEREGFYLSFHPSVYRQFNLTELMEGKDIEFTILDNHDTMLKWMQTRKVCMHNWFQHEWGKRVGLDKPPHEEWHKFSNDMLERVLEDVKINVKVWEALMKEKKDWEDKGESWDKAIQIEYATADLVGRQELHGTLFDQEKAFDLADELYIDIQKIDETLLEQIPNRVVKGTEVLEPFRKDGKLKEVVNRWFS